MKNRSIAIFRNVGGQHMSDGKEDYLVVFEYSKTAGDYAGCRFWTPFDSEADFKASPPVPGLTVVAAGVSEEESLRLCEQTSLVSRVRATMADAGYGTEHYDPEYAKLVTGFLFSDRHAKG